MSRHELLCIWFRQNTKGEKVMVLPYPLQVTVGKSWLKNKSSEGISTSLTLCWLCETALGSNAEKKVKERKVKFGL